MTLKNRKIGLFLVLALVAASVTLADAEKHEQIDSLVAQYVELGQFNGTALVAKDGKVVHRGGYGLAQMEWDLPNTPETKFRLGSITKQFTAMLILQQVEAGELNAHDSLGEALTEAGETEAAIKSYARSLELDPSNRNAVEKLSELIAPQE